MKRKASEKTLRRRNMADNYINQRKKMILGETVKLISGNVLLIGAEKGFEISALANAAQSLTIVDKTIKDLRQENLTNVEYHFMKFPSLSGLTSNSFDYVLSLGSIEHITDDFGLLSEVVRVLRPEGSLIVSTPNKKMTLVRNPWHKREYTVDEFKNLIGSYFKQVQAMGIYGKANVAEYYEKNKKSVQTITRLDILNFTKWLPDILLKLPYHLFNRINRKRLLLQNRTLTLKITADDYLLDEAMDDCYDLFFVAQK